jgi:hypothetical protein
MLKRLILFAAISLVSVLVRAQMTNTLYFMDRIPQYNLMNPAFQPKCNAFVGLTGVYLNVGSPFSLNDVLTYNASLDSLITIFHPKAAADAKDNFIKSLSDVESAYVNSEVNLLSFGFRVSDWYFTFGATNKQTASFNIPKSYLQLGVKGFEANTTYELGNLGVNVTDYVEFALGASKKISPELTLGAKGKFLYGIADFSVGDNTLNYRTSVVKDSTYSTTINANLTYNGYFPFAKMPDSIMKQSPKLYSTDSIINNLLAFNSTGFAIDFGAKYTGIEKLSLSASILDLGFIRWNNEVYNTTMKGSYTFTGLEIDLLSDSTTDYGKKITDTLNNAFTYSQSNKSYTTWLPTKVIFGIEYFPEEYFSVGLMSLSQFNRSKFYQQFVLSANVRPLQMIMLSGSYSVLNNGFSSFGAGLTFRLSALQFYFVADNIPFKFGKSFIPYKMNSFNCRLGLNLVFGCNGNKNKEKDKPMIYE